jgi:NhaA family Na+:H+ antiporter
VPDETVPDETVPDETVPEVAGPKGWGRRLASLVHSDVAGGVVLVAAVAAAMVWANLLPAGYAGVWLAPVHVGASAFGGMEDVRAWVNGGLMAVFFLVVGLEIGRERRHGDLANARTALAPVAGALGGMAGAGIVYAVCVRGGPGASGWGIPMATDIAFALGALALLGRHVPSGLRVFLLTLAVADDIGSVVVLAVCYSSALAVWPLVAAAVVVGVLALARSSARVPTAALLAGGVILWVLLAAGGVEPALAGVATGLLVPGARAGAPGDPAAVLERRVAPWSAFVVLPVFALANAGITFHAGMLAGPGAASVFWGVTAARVVGKAVGIPLAALAVVRLGWGRLPDGLRWRHVVGGAAVAGIGFTVPLLVAERAFPHDVALVTAAELGLFAGSAAAVALGAVVLLSVSRAAGARPAVAPARPEPTDEDGRPLPW